MDRAPVILDNFLADREAKPGPAGLPERCKRLEKRVGDFGGNALARVLYLRQNDLVGQLNANVDLSSSGLHRIDGIVDQIEKNVW